MHLYLFLKLILMIIRNPFLHTSVSLQRPFMYSISEGISSRNHFAVVINLVCGQGKRKKISPLLYILAVIFVLK